MKGLFKDKEDGTLFVAELNRAVYLTDSNELYCTAANEDDICIKMPQKEAENAIKLLFEHNKVDFTNYTAELNPEDDYEADY